MSKLKKCLRVPTDRVDVADVQLESDLTYAEYPTKILDRKERVTRHRHQVFYKVQWSNHSEEEATWEHEDILKANYPEILASVEVTSLPHFRSFARESRGEILFKGGGL